MATPTARGASVARRSAALAVAWFVLAAAVPARAETRRGGAEDDARKGIALHDELISIEAAIGTRFFSMSSYFNGTSSTYYAHDGEERSGVGVTLHDVSLRLHMMQALGVSFGVYRMSSSEGGVRAEQQDCYWGTCTGGAPGGSFSDTGAILGIEMNPIGWQNVQTSLAWTITLGGPFVSMYSAGLRINLGSFKLLPRLTYAETSVDGYDATSELWGYGAELIVAWTGKAVRP